MKLKDKLEEFIETHEFEIGVAAGIVACGVGLTVACVSGKFMTRTIEGLPAPELEIGKIGLLWDEWWNKKACEKCKSAVVTDLTIADLGRFGNELTKIEGVELESPVQLVVSALMKQYSNNGKGSGNGAFYIFYAKFTSPFMRREKD